MYTRNHKVFMINMVTKHTLRSVLSRRHSGIFFAAFLLICAVLAIGITLSMSLRADTATTASFQSESATLSGVTVVDDTSAAGQKAVRFGSGQAASGSVTVDFNQAVRTVTPYAFSGTISTYGSDGGSIGRSSKQRTMLGNLKLGYYRVPLRWNGGNIVSSAGGGPTDISGDTWVNTIIGFGGQPMIVLGGSEDNNFTPSEAANMVRHFDGVSGPKVSRWVIGNEPGNGGMSIQTYCNLFNSTVDAMKAVDSTIKVAGPAWAYFDSGNLTAFLQCAGSKVDIIDYHHYAMGTTFVSNAEALSQTNVYANEVTQARQLINQYAAGRSGQIEIQVGEYNWSWRTGNGYQGYNGDDRFYQSVNTVWTASVAGQIMLAGGRGHQYSDQNGALGVTFEKNSDAAHFGRTLNDPMPMYWGLNMFTGGNLFRSFGTTAVQASTQLANVEVYASNNQKNVVLVNKDPSASRAASVALNNSNSGSAQVWQTDKDLPFTAPINKGSVAITNNVLNVTLPPYSVTTLVLQ